MKTPSLLPHENLAEGLRTESVKTIKELAYNTVVNPRLMPNQKLESLAKLAEDALPYPEMSGEARRFIEEGIICQLFEGAAPYRPRYIAPDYSVVLRNGSKTLDLPAPKDLYEAITTLLAAYKYVPSITGYPVYFGQLDELLEPFMDTVTSAEARSLLRMYWRLLDKQNPDGFTHINLGPLASRVGELVFEIDREMVQAVPNVSFKYDPEITPDDFAARAAANAVTLNKPYFINHRMNVSDWGERYAVASCYNLFPIGGGSHTLVRMDLKRLVEEFLAWSGTAGYGTARFGTNGFGNDSVADGFLNEAIPMGASLLAEVISARIRFIVDEVGFFRHSFLVEEGWLSQDRFTAMAGFVGLAEAVNTLMERAGKSGWYGHDEEANRLAREIIARFHRELKAIPAPYCEASGGRVIFHAQTGIDTDHGVTAGARVPAGSEPELYDHIRVLAPHDRYFDGGVSSIFLLEKTAAQNPEAVLDIVRGAFKQGIRLFATGCKDSDLIRISGWLMKRSELEQYRRGETLVKNSSNLGGAHINNLRLTARRIHTLPVGAEHASQPEGAYQARDASHPHGDPQSEDAIHPDRPGQSRGQKALKGNAK